MPPIVRSLVAGLLLAASLGSMVGQEAAEPAAVEPRVMPLVVKIHSTQRFPDVFRPWTLQDAQRVSGSGVIIEGRRILTNAHVVRNASQIYVQPHQSSDMLEARVAGFAPGIDLAVLELEDPTFFEGRGHVEIDGDLPHVKDKVSVYGYPMGGSELSVTEGIVSRIEYTGYYGPTTGMRVQVDAALNPGNSGGPAFVNGRMIGLVFSGIPSSQSIGYLIPAEEIQLFLADIADGSYRGKPMMPDGMQTMENYAIREKLGLPADKGGFMIINAYDDHGGTYPLRRWDVLTQVGDYPLDRQGNVRVNDDLRVDFRYLLQRLDDNGLVPGRVWRDGREIEVSVPMVYDLNLVIKPLHNDRPRYFFYGPLVFSVATQELAARLAGNRNGIPRAATPLLSRLGDKPEFEGEEIVFVCTRAFSSSLMKGYDDPFLFVLDEVNGVKVKNLVHLVEILRDMKEKFVAFKFHGDEVSTPEIPVFEHARMLEETEKVIEENGIRSPYSDDIAQVWNAKP